MNIIGRRKIFLSVAAVLTVAAIIAVLFFGLKQGIDLAGGSLWQLRIAAEPSADLLKDFFRERASQGGVIGDAIVSRESSTNSFIVRTGEISEADHQRRLAALRERFGEIEELRFENIGPAIGNELRKKAIWAGVLVLLGISLYITYAFRKVAYPVKSWKYGVIALITLFHDVIIPTGLAAFLGWRLGTEIDTSFIVALLVIMGFSIHDTIVVFDRTRENLLLSRSSKVDLESVVNQSVNETLARSVNTSLTLVLVVAALYFLGPASLSTFLLIILTGTIVGTYSSIFVASPLLVVWHKLSKT
ncbi:MAG: protein translocase subunit SecF [Parcubacteria group bacterium]|nr:protein translocase subunit SecF [Parcubacteria group bacterium]